MASGIRPCGKPVGSGQLKLLTAVREENQMFGINVARGVSELSTILQGKCRDLQGFSDLEGGGDSAWLVGIWRHRNTGEIDPGLSVAHEG